MRHETISVSNNTNGNIKTYLLDDGEYERKGLVRPAVIICPGGGYTCVSANEGEPVAMFFNRHGYHAFVLRYSVKEHATWPNPINDFDEAMDLIRSKCEEWKIYSDKIAVVGFSAGGHLAAAAATMSKNRPNAALLGYAVASEDVKGCNETAPDTTKYVDKNTYEMRRKHI